MVDLSEIKAPAQQKIWERLSLASGKHYIVTSNASRSKYFLYEVATDGKLSKLGVDEDPLSLKNDFLVKKKAKGKR